MKIKYFIHELNDQGEVIDTTPFDERSGEAFMTRDLMRRVGKKVRVERATFNENGVVVNKEDVT